MACGAQINDRDDKHETSILILDPLYGPTRPRLCTVVLCHSIRREMEGGGRKTCLCRCLGSIWSQDVSRGMECVDRGDERKDGRWSPGVGCWIYRGKMLLSSLIEINPFIIFKWTSSTLNPKNIQPSTTSHIDPPRAGSVATTSGIVTEISSRVRWRTGLWRGVPRNFRRKIWNGSRRRELLVMT